MIEFEPYPKTHHYCRRNVMCITEKIDGTNAQIGIDETGLKFIGSRNKIIGIGDDNAGFARWVVDNEEQLVSELGVGVHYGEWAGPGIQKNPLRLETKRFFLFDGRWYQDLVLAEACPVLYHGGILDYSRIKEVLEALLAEGTQVPDAAGRPEGLIINVHGQRFKVKP